MSLSSTEVLLVESDAKDVLRIQQALTGSRVGQFNLAAVDSLGLALAYLRVPRVDVVLMNFSLLDAHGLTVFKQIYQLADNALILILCMSSEEEIGRQAVKLGAQDYFIKEHIDAHWFPRALGYHLERKLVQDALLASELRFRSMSDVFPFGIFVSDAQGQCVYANAAYKEVSGINVDQPQVNSWSLELHEGDRTRVLSEWAIAMHDDVPFQTEARLQPKDGSEVWVQVNAVILRSGPPPHGYIHVFEDISARKAMEQVLRISEEALFGEKERAEVTLNSIGDAVLATDTKSQVTYMNQAASRMTGWTQADAMGLMLPEVFRILHSTTRQAVPSPARQVIEYNKEIELASDCVLIRRDGLELSIEDSAAPIHNREGRVTGAVIVFHDVSESRAMTKKMAHQAQHDVLTDLPNRALLTERLFLAVAHAKRHQRHVALLFIDLDAFKLVNDSLGHAIGDQLLQSVAARLSACVRATDTVCRQGGDEFVILLTEIEHPLDAAQVANNLLAAFAEPHFISGHELHITLSMGISIYPGDGLNPEAVMQNADIAMYHAKACGRNNYQFFKPDMNNLAVCRLLTESNLHRALKQDEFVLYYQPKVDLVSGKMTSAEALLRWEDPHQGLVLPAQFITIAEECGLILQIGRWVLREVCLQVRQWMDAGLQVVPVAINISAIEFRHPGFLDGVTQIIQETGILPLYLEFELTESILMHHAESSLAILLALKQMGIQLAVDDFGTGYSSLSYLKRFPIDTLKIDRSFVSDIATDADDATIVSAVIGMGVNLNKRVIAEGVETREQLAFLQSQQCNEGQGYLFSHPLPAEVFKPLLAQEDHPTPLKSFF